MRPKNLKFPFSWKDRKPIFYEGILVVPEYVQSKEIKNSIFFDKNFYFIEFCSGNGDWIIQKALENPNSHWIAVEKEFQRVRKIWSKMKNQDLKNLLIVWGKAETFVQYYVPNEKIEKVFINFPDPWPKQKHAKHRLIQTPFVEGLFRILKKGGSSTLLTDSITFRDQILKTFSNEKWSCCFPKPFYTQKWENYGESWFEKLWRKKGYEFFYLQFSKEDS